MRSMRIQHGRVNPLDGLVTMTEAAKMLHCSETWVRKLLDLGALPEFRVRHHRYTYEDAVERRIEAKRLGKVRPGRPRKAMPTAD